VNFGSLKAKSGVLQRRPARFPVSRIGREGKPGIDGR